MRDLILLVALVALAPMVWRTPIVGILAWIWITLMSPQREVYGFLHGFELNFWIAVVTILAWAGSRERKLVPPSLLALIMILFGLWTCVTTYFALDPQFSQVLLLRTLKTLALGLAVITLVNTKLRIQVVIWAVVAALEYYSVKGGGFVLLTGGRNHVYGPEATMIADNNSLALALIALLPLLLYLRATSAGLAARLVAVGLITLSLLAIVGTYSRGALLAIAAAGATYAMRSRNGVIVMVLVALGAVSLSGALPASWMHRMATIQSYNDDASFAGRVAAWKTAMNIVAKRPVVGGGFSATNLDWVAQKFHTDDSLDAGKAAHSIYFEVLGDHGVVGLALYLVMVGVAVANTVMTLRATRGRADLAWAAQLARMLQVSIVAILVGGALLSMAYYDGFIIIFALTSSLLRIVRQPAAQLAEIRTQPKWARAAPAPAVLPAPRPALSDSR